MKRPKIPLLYASDQRYIAHLATSLHSLLIYNSEIISNIALFTSNLPEKEYIKLQSIAKIFDKDIDFYEMNSLDFEGLKTNCHFQSSNYYRVLAADYIKSDICLYVDSDTVITSSLEELLEVDLNDKFIAAVQDLGYPFTSKLGMSSSAKYFNSGVMLINLRKWREFGLREAVFEFVKNNEDLILYVDQCGLNRIINGDWAELPNTYNFQTSMLEGLPDSECLAPKIIHYTGNSKPWHLNNRHKFKKTYWDARNKTIYRSFYADDFGLRSLAWLLIPRRIIISLKIFLAYCLKMLSKKSI